MENILITNGKLVNEGKCFEADILIKGERIEKIGNDLSASQAGRVIDAAGKYIFPGAIDDQVHFREPGLTHKATIYTESRAAVAGGVTSFMEMPNTKPQAVTQELLEEKYAIGSKGSLANYSFFMGATNDNVEEVLKTDPSKVCGVKVFMGSSTGNMLVDDPKALENLFSRVGQVIAVHCEDEATIKANLESYKLQYGEDIPISAHPKIRSEEACYLSSSLAADMARKHGARLHILHISTAKELALFQNDILLEEKQITAEACIHHLWFSDKDYNEKGTFIKWNPAVKQASDRDAIFKAVLDGRIDVIATDHAPHTREEKSQKYLSAPSGGPLVQHSLQAMLDFYHQGEMDLPMVAQKMAHNPARLFRVKERGYLREGYFADLAIVDLGQPQVVTKDNLHYKCQWSPFEGHCFKSTVQSTLVSGHLAYHEGQFDNARNGKRLLFNV